MSEKSIIPLYIEKTLERRRKLAVRLAETCADLDSYCEHIGVDLSDPDISLGSDIKIYCEPNTAYYLTREAIIDTLSKATEGNWNNEI